MKDKTPQQASPSDNLFEGWEDASDVEFFDAGNDDDADNDKKGITPALDDDEDEEGDDAVNLDGDDDATDKKKAGSKKKAPAVDVDAVLNFDDDSEEEEDDEDDEDDSKKKTPKEKTSKVSDSVRLLNSLKEKGFIELGDDEEITDENADDLLADKYEDSIEKRVEELMASLPSVTKDLVKFALKGGNEADFLSKLSTSKAKGISEDMDLSKEENQIAVMKANLKADGYDDDYVTAQIEFMKDSGKLESLSKGVHKKIIDRSAAERAADVKAVADNKAAQKEKLREYKKSFSKLVSENDELNGFTLSKADKAELPSYLTDATVKNGESNVTPFQRDLYNALQDSNKTAIIAKILRSDFDFSEIANKSRTAQAKDIKKDVRRTSKKTPATSGSSQKSKPRRSLADMFD